MSKVGAAIILAFSRDPGEEDFHTPGVDWSLEPLSILERDFPSLDAWVRDKTVLDFGCGYGFQCVALKERGAKKVLGIDSNPMALERAVGLAKDAGVSDDVSFAPSLDARHFGKFDVVLSQNAMEHFASPESIMRDMCNAVRVDGRILITFGPPWFAPYGGHMHFFTRIPWVTVFFSEDSVMRARGRYRADGAEHYHEVESGLNKMSLARFERLLADLQLTPEFSQYTCVKQLSVLSRVPLLREFFVNHVSVSVRLGPMRSSS